MELRNKLEEYDKILILTDECWEFNYKMIDCFEKRLKQQQMKGSILLHEKRCFLKNTVDFFYIDTKKVQELYQLYKFTDKIIWGSLSKPYGRHWNNLISSGCITEEQAIEAIVYF